jgi:FkbM family methyltransferase
MLAAANLAMLARLLPHVSAAHRSGMARRLMQDRFNPRTRVLAGFFRKAGLAWQNKQYELDRNGEAALLRRLALFRPTTLFDVGANVGDWSLEACCALPSAKVHAFEIAPSTAEQLRSNAAAFLDRLIVNTLGLSDREGEITIYLSPESSTATSTIRKSIELAAEEHGIRNIMEVGARVVTGDAYMQRHGIAEIDLLKIDVEGAEAAVLEGFASAFAAKTIQMVQFEYGAMNAVTRFLLADFYHFFTERGFLVGQLLPEGVAFKPYEVGDENFQGPNFIACLQDRADLIAALRCPPLTVA